VFKRTLKRVFVRISSLFGVPQIHARLDRLELEVSEIRVDRIQDEARLASFERFLARRLDERLEDNWVQHSAELQTLWKEVLAHVDRVQAAMTDTMVRHTEAANSQVLHDMKRITDELAEQVARHRRYVDNLQLPVSSQIPNQSIQSHLAPINPVTDAFYVALEDNFRGSRDVIKVRQSSYLPILRSAPVESHAVLDLGCGRGEWLSLLKEEGIDARGVDSNLACVSECIAQGLEVEHGDLIEHLRGLPDQSCAAVTLFQVLEHLPFPVLLDVMRQVSRVLTNGGVLIAEVPNSENLSVAASTFWIDPTHQRPLFPGLLRFLAIECGFVKTEGLYSTPLSPPPDLSGMDASAREALARVYAALYGDADFALIAWA
jgi:O-antigen chain-terminating methyltransferase